MRRAVAWLGTFAATLLFRRVEVAGDEHFPRRRPVLLVANHFNGFVDPVLITSALGRTPRFIAKAELAEVPLAGFLLRRMGVVFVRRPSAAPDGTTVDNADAFAECHRALARRDTVAIFPEGTTHDRPRVDPIRTGAARIALGARAAGAQGLTIVPVGLTFPDKVALRSSALVQFGPPIELDEVSPPERGEGADAVTDLTAVIDRGLRAVSPDYADIETALALEQAAHLALSSQREGEPSLAARHALARQLGRASEADQERVCRAVGRYTTVLSGLHLSDGDVITPTSPTRLVRSAVGIGVLVVLLGGLVAATALVNVWPAGLVALASLLVRTPVSKGTVRVLVGVLAFPVAWIGAAVAAADGVPRVSLLTITFAVGAVAAVWLVERAMALAQMLLRWQAQRERIGTVAWAQAVRDEVAATVQEIAGAPS